MNRVSKRGQQYNPEKLLPFFFFLASQPLIPLCLAVLSFALLLIDINDTEQHDPTLFFRL